MFKLIKTIKSKTGEVHFKRWLLWKGKDYEVYFHKICKADEDKHLHNHPWDILWTTVLWGSYLEAEQMYKDDELLKDCTRYVIRSPFRTKKAKAERFHKISSLVGTVFSIMVVGPRRNPDWGFLVDGKTVQHEEYRKLKRANLL